MVYKLSILLYRNQNIYKPISWRVAWLRGSIFRHVETVFASQKTVELYESLVVYVQLSRIQSCGRNNYFGTQRDKKGGTSKAKKYILTGIFIFQLVLSEYAWSFTCHQWGMVNVWSLLWQISKYSLMLSSIIWRYLDEIQKYPIRKWTTFIWLNDKTLKQKYH